MSIELTIASPEQRAPSQSFQATQPSRSGLNLERPPPHAAANLDLFDVSVLRIGFSPSLTAARVSVGTARQPTAGWLEFARRRPGRADSPPSPGQAPTPGSNAKSCGQRRLSNLSAWKPHFRRPWEILTTDAKTWKRPPVPLRFLHVGASTCRRGEKSGNDGA
jgi:hypothetical protein